MNDELPKDYVRIPFPSLPPKERWEDTVMDRARITDPDFHRGCSEAIRLVERWEEKIIHPPWAPAGYKLTQRSPVPGKWLEFRDFKAANTYVQAVKRLSR